MPYDAPGQESFDDKVRAVLADTMRLPPEFLNFLTQRSNLYPPQLGALIAPSINATGLGNAVKASRYVGATASGHPTSGYFKVGDFAVDQTGDIWICTVAGSPGTWVDVKGSGSSLSYAIAGGGSPVTVPTTGTKYLSAGTTASYFYTNDSSTFTFGSKTVSDPTSRSVYGIKLNAFGNYLAICQYGSFSSPPASGLVHGIDDPDFSNTGSMVMSLWGPQVISGLGSPYLVGPQDAVLVVFDSGFSNTIPSDPLVFKAHNYDGSNTFDASGNVLVIALPGASATSLL